VTARRREPGRGEDEEAIRKLVRDMTDGFNRHDARAATAMYTADADLVTVRGERFRGAAELERGLASIFETRARSATLTTQALTIRFIRPDVALVHVTNELGGLVATDGQHVPAHEELSVRVFVKEGGAWRVAAFHNTIVRPFGS
jgi:uncharacterized protein (TIGR02246 family)